MSSWITGIAEKAENVLNKIDQNAAVALKNNEPSLIDIEEIKRQMEKQVAMSSPRRQTVMAVTGDEADKGSMETSAISDLSLDDDNKSQKGQKPNDEESVSESFKVEKELAAYKIALADVISERDELKEELSLIERDQEQELKLKTVIETLKREKEVSEEEKQLLQSTIKDLIANSSLQSKTLAELESSLVKVRQDYLDGCEQLTLQKRECTQIALDFDTYKKKALNRLADKDKLIESLRSNDSSSVVESNEFTLLLKDYESLQDENRTLELKLKSIVLQQEELKNVADSQKITLDRRAVDWQETQAKLRANVLQEQNRVAQYESDVKMLNQEITVVREEMQKQRSAFTSRLHDKEKEIETLRFSASSAPSVLSNPDESRLKNLTATLVEKQSAIEHLTAEKTALKLQLESMEQQMQHLIQIQNASKRNELNLRSEFISLNDTDDAKAQLPHIMRANPFDSRVARRVKRAYSSLDSAGIQIGKILRQYPLIRSLVFIYVVILHIWVMFVLLSSTPSI